MVHWVDEWRIGKASNADVEKLTSSQICYSLNRRYATKSRAGVCYWKFIKFYLLILANCNEFWIINWFLVKCLRQCHWSINAFVCKKCANHDFIAQLTKSKLFFEISYRTSKALWDFFNMHICNADAPNSLIWQIQYRWQVVSLGSARMIF